MQRQLKSVLHHVLRPTTKIYPLFVFSTQYEILAQLIHHHLSIKTSTHKHIPKLTQIHAAYLIATIPQSHTQQIRLIARLLLQ